MKKAKTKVIFELVLAGFLAIVCVEYVLAVDLDLQPAKSYGAENVAENVNDIKDWLFGIVKMFLGITALVTGGLVASKLVLAQGNEEEYGKLKKWIIWSMVGLIIVSIAEPLVGVLTVKDNHFLDGGSVDNTYMAFNTAIATFLNFLSYILGSIAILMIVLSGTKLIVSQGDEELISKQKTFFVWGLGGLALYMLSGEIMATVYGRLNDGGQVSIGLDAQQGRNTLREVTEWLLQAVGAMGVLTLVVSAILYIVSGDNDGRRETAKKIMIGTIIAIVLAYSCYTIVNEIVIASQGGSGIF